MIATDAKTHAHQDAWRNQPTLADLTAQDIWSLRAGFLQRLLPQVEGNRVLEVGSGPAHDSIPLARRGAKITALDCSRTGLDLAEAIYAEAKLPILTVLGDATDLPFQDDQFDMCFNGGVLEHFTDEQLQPVLDEMIRVARPGGTVLAFCPNRYNIYYQTHLRRVEEHGYHFERAFVAGEMARRLRARGLPNVFVSGVHVHPAPNYLLPGWLPKHHRIEPICRRCFGWLERSRYMNRLKALIGQDFVVWAEVPTTLGPREDLAGLPGGPVVRGAGDGRDRKPRGHRRETSS